MDSQNGLVTTIAWGLGGKVQYALEGSVFTAGAAIQWLRDELHLLDSAAESEYLARQVPDTNGCYVVPAFSGLGAPHWDSYARGTIVGLTRGVNRNHIIRATLDALAYQTVDVLRAMRADSGIDLASLKVDGGASANNYLMQAQADLTGAPVLRPRCVETTAMGASYLAGLAVGIWSSPREVARNWSVDRTFQPELEPEERDRRLTGWHRAVSCSRGWAKEEGHERNTIPAPGAGRTHRDVFRSFERRQVVDWCWRRERGQWVIRQDPFVDQWSEADYAFLVTCLQHTLSAGGVVFGAFCEGNLKGFASVEHNPLGSHGQYRDLTSLHVSQELRGNGLGRRLFGLAADWAKGQGAEKLYISGHSAVETQAFYQAMGCREAEECSQEHVSQEPFDCQLEYVLSM